MSGKGVKIFVVGYIKGETTAVFIQFQKPEQVSFFPKSRLRYAHVMQFTSDLRTTKQEVVAPCWSIVDILNPILSVPVDSVSW